MAVVRARYGLIERLTEQLLSEFEVCSPPVPVERMATAKGCVIRQSDLGEISGILVRSSSGSVIGVNKTHPETRRRFTIAHELGHFLLHQGEGVTYDEDFRVSLRSDQSSTGTDVAEIEANFFAASLLMPNGLLLADPRTKSIELEDSNATSDLAATFGVSTQAVTLRLARLIDRQGRSALSGRQARFF